MLGNGKQGITLNNSQNITLKNVGNWTNFESSAGGAINNNQGIITIADTSFTNNKASTNGGAFNNNAGIINIIAENTAVKFENNTINEESNAIYSENGKISLNAYAENNIIFSDKLTSDTTSVLNITATQTEESTVPENASTNETIVINNDMSGYKGDVNLYHGTIKIGENGISMNRTLMFMVAHWILQTA